jgi:Mor family transcriptional regulator
MCTSFIEELPGDLRKIAEVAGLDAALKIGRAFRGTHLYIRGLDPFLRIVRDEKIRRDYGKGGTPRVLSARYGLTTRQIRRILGEEPVRDIPDTLLDLMTDKPVL